MDDLEFTEAPEFIEDGHVIAFALERDALKVVEVICPNVGSTSLCNRRRTYCVVQRFIDAYGMDLNIGNAPLNGPIEIAWFPVYGDESDLDSEYETVWIVPVVDTDYQISLEERAAAAELLPQEGDISDNVGTEDPPDDDPDDL